MDDLVLRAGFSGRTFQNLMGYLSVMGRYDISPTRRYNKPDGDIVDERWSTESNGWKTDGWYNCVLGEWNQPLI